MKYDRLRTFLGGFLLSAAVSVGSVGCLITGFSLDIDSFIRIVCFCLLAAALGSLPALRRNANILVFCLLAFMAGYLWHLRLPGKQLAALIYRISTVYDGAYHWGILQLTDAASIPMAADYPAGILGCLTALVVSRSIVRRRGVTLPLLLGVLPLAACLVVTDMVPDRLWLFLLLFGEAMLLLTGFVRQESSTQANRLARMAAVPVLVMLGLIFWLNPQQGYVNRTVKTREWILEQMDRLPGTVADRLETVTSNVSPMLTRRSVNLASLGAQPRGTTPVMEVTAQYGGTVYLRGQDYDEYTGTSWISGEDRQESVVGSGQDLGTIRVRTLSVQRSLYLPSYPLGEVSFSGGRSDNPDRLTEYDCTRVSRADYRMTTDRMYEYLKLPQSCSNGLSPIVDELNIRGTGPDELARAVADYVSTRARYDRGTGPMNPDAEDFVLWFLEQSDTGYCVHFASAAVVLLRSLGVPARYVTGYMTLARQGETVTVTSGDAHAWAEFYDGESWIVLEATPADVIAEREADPSTQSQQGTQPAPVEDPATPSTQPEQSNQPDSPAKDEQFRRRVGTLVLWLAGVFACCCAVWLQRVIRVRLRSRRLRSGDTNAQALACWQDMRQLCRLLGEEPGSELEAMAEKAAYSQYTLTEEEVSHFFSLRRTLIRRLRQQPLHRRMLYMFVYALY